jgi:hypothetical protein
MPEPIMLDDGLRFRSEVPEIGETRAVDAGRQPASPAAPHQSADIEQDGRVVSHSIKLDERKEEAWPFQQAWRSSMEFRL